MDTGYGVIYVWFFVKFIVL